MDRMCRERKYSTNSTKDETKLFSVLCRQRQLDIKWNCKVSTSKSLWTFPFLISLLAKPDIITTVNWDHRILEFSGKLEIILSWKFLGFDGIGLSWLFFHLSSWVLLSLLCSLFLPCPSSGISVSVLHALLTLSGWSYSLSCLLLVTHCAHLSPDPQSRSPALSCSFPPQYCLISTSCSKLNIADWSFL